MDTFLAYLDQFRYMTGILAICIVLCRKALTHKTPYLARISVSAAFFYLLAFAYVPRGRANGPGNAAGDRSLLAGDELRAGLLCVFLL